MSNPKRKSENYNSFGGINTKISSYLNTPLEFLDLVNFDFQTPGALTQVWGSTQYVGQTFAGRINTLVEFNKLDGSSYVIVGHSGALWSGATTGNSQGLSLTHGVTTSGIINNGLAIVFSGGNIIETSGDDTLYKDTLGLPFDIGNAAGATFAFASQVLGNNKMSCVPFQNWLFMADGQKYIKYDGASTYAVGLPPPIKTGIVGLAGSNNGTTLGFAVSTGFYSIYGQLVNNRGFPGPIWPLGCITATGSTTSTATLISFAYEIQTPLIYGISSINVFTYGSGSTIIPLVSGATPFWNLPYRFLQNLPASGSTVTNFNVGSTSGGVSLVLNNLGGLPGVQYEPIGATYVFNSSENKILSINVAAVNPRFLEVYKERLFAAGFSAALSNIIWSDTGEPEGYPPENTAEVRTNDSDYITGLKTFKSALTIFKRNSFHAFTGDNANNFLIQEVSTEYGCVNHWSTAQFNNTLAFLDRKGVIAWNGSSIENISTKVQPIFDRMNYQAALNEACMIHDKLRNQIVVAFPVDGATLNNMIMAFDYNVGAWTKHAGYAPSVLSTIQGRNQTKNMFYGSYSGVVNWSGSSFLAHNGSGFTTYIKSRFLHDIGESYTKIYRRFFANIDAPGTTLQFGINFFQDYGNSLVLQTTMVISQFQQRIDFGLSAKSIAFEMSSLQTTVPLKFNGFTIESRKLRDV